MPTPDQKRQAAAIFTAASEGKVIEVNHRYDGWRKCDPFAHGTRLKVLKHPELYRIAPDPIAPGHNKFKLTTSVVGQGFRLVEESEGLGSDHSKQWWEALEHWSFGWCRYFGPDRWHASDTLRTRLSVEALAALDKPVWRLPDPPAGKRWHREDGWAEADLPSGTRPLLRGEKAIRGDQYRSTASQDWFTQAHQDCEPAEDYDQLWQKTTRPLPVFNPRDIPGFRPLLPTEQPHRDDFTEADLPEGCRPLLLNEEIQKGDEFFHDGRGVQWKTSGYGAIGRPCDPQHFKHRTRRPLPAIPRTRRWSKPEDVPGPVCWLRNHKETNWMVIAVCKNGIHYTGGGYQNPLLWEELKHYEYSLDRKTWQRCETTEAE